MVKALYITVALMLTLTTGIYLMKHFHATDHAETGLGKSHEDNSPKGDKNPLIGATRAEFDRWLPPYCGPDLYVSKKTKAHAIDICVAGTIQRVESTTGIQLSREDVLNPVVREHWRATMGVTR